VRGRDKSCLPYTQWQGWYFTTTWFLNQWTNNPCVSMVPWSVFLGLVSWACLTSSSALKMAVVWLDNYPLTQLEIATQLVRKLGHQIGHYLWHLLLKWASGETIWQCWTSMRGKTKPLCGSPPPRPPSLCNHLW